MPAIIWGIWAALAHTIGECVSFRPVDDCGTRLYHAFSVAEGRIAVESLVAPHGSFRRKLLVHNPTSKRRQIACRPSLSGKEADLVIAYRLLTILICVQPVDGRKRKRTHIGIMPVIKDHSPFGLGIMPDHACDRGAARLDPGASRSQAYQSIQYVSCGRGRGRHRLDQVPGVVKAANIL